MTEEIVLNSIEKVAFLGLLRVNVQRGTTWNVGWLMAEGYPRDSAFDPWPRIVELGLATMYKKKKRTVIAFTKFGYEYAQLLRSFEDL